MLCTELLHLIVRRLYCYHLVFRYEEQMEVAAHRYKKEVKHLNNELLEAASRLTDMQDQVSQLLLL